MMKVNLSCNNYFFDFFGTIMNRTCSADDVKKLWSNRLSKRLGFCVSSSVLYSVRREAEKQVCRKERDFEFTYRELTDNIYRRILCIATNFAYDNDKFYEVAKETELSVESDVQVVNEPVKELIMKLKSMNKHVYILSDFYLAKDCFSVFLEDKGLADIAEDIFVSCDFGTNKSSGKIYPLVLSKLSLSPTDCCMIGDNRNSDFINAKAHGLKAVNIKENKKYNRNINSKKELSKFLTYEKKSGLSYSNYSFYLYLFTERLYKELVLDSYSQVFFLSREGEFLKKLFDIYSDCMHRQYGLPKIKSKYLYVSRQSTYPASLKPLSQEDFSTLFHSYPSMSIRIFLRHIGISEEVSEDIISKLSCNASEDITNIAQSEEFSNLLSNNKFKKAYEEKITADKKIFIDYLTQEGFFDEDKAALVDVGWRGSIQDYIARCIDGKVNITGYYAGLRNDVQITDVNHKIGLMFSQYPYKTPQHSIWSFDSNFMERLLSASHPSTKSYTYENKNVTPIFNDFGSEENNYKLIAPVQNYTAEKFNCILNSIHKLPLLDEEQYRLFSWAHINTCCKVSSNNMKLQQKLLKGQNENFGYLVVSGDRLKKVFSAKNILRKVFGNMGILRNVDLIARVLMTKGLYGCAAAIYRSNKRRLRKETKR